MMTEHNDRNFQQAVAFIRSIGIPVSFAPIDAPTLLPGLSIQNGGILVDPERLKYPGDILHEAGHIAVVPPAERPSLCDELLPHRQHRDAEEMMAIAWSYAACLHLGLDAAFVFHDEGYQGGGSSIADNFGQGHYFGVPMLQWVGMTREKKSDPGSSEPVYPDMRHWLRPEPPDYSTIESSI